MLQQLITAIKVFPSSFLCSAVSGLKLKEKETGVLVLSRKSGKEEKTQKVTVGMGSVSFLT